MRKTAERIDVQLKDLQDVSGDMFDYISAIFSAIEMASSDPSKRQLISSLAACGQHLIESTSGNVSYFCEQIAEASREVPHV